MTDIIQLLPDSIANQIAAGEVVQRPASVVKELMENSVDAQSTTIQLIVKDAGKSLIQVIDDGIGMSETDARMSFERHATSKIRSSNDLFSIRTLGFRGEALASIAAVAQIDLRTRRRSDELGTLIRIEGSEIKAQGPVACMPGTNFSVKNLFFNVPARRTFLRSNAVEMRHILDDFQRIALANPQIAFSLYQNDLEVYNLPIGKLSHRIVSLFGKSYREQLASCQEETDFVKVSGYIGKPNFAKKTRGEQFFFVNNRFIRHSYLHHAVMTAFEGLLPDESYPFYVLFIEIDPSHIDINVHPTKTEIKFDDERAVYAIVQAAVRRALGAHNITPSLDFDLDVNFTNFPTWAGTPGQPRTPVTPPNTTPKDPTGASNTGTTNNTSESYSKPTQSFEKSPLEKSNQKNWQALYQNFQQSFPKEQIAEVKQSDDTPSELTFESKANSLATSKPVTQQLRTNEEPTTFQLHNRYIVTQVKSGMLIIDQQAAHPRILYEKFLTTLSKRNGVSQQTLFPKTIELNPSDFELLLDMEEDIASLGFVVKVVGKCTVVVQGIPADVAHGDEKELLEGLLEQFKWHQSELNLGKRENIARALARRSALKPGMKLSVTEMNTLIDQLFASANPNYAPDGSPTLVMLNLEKIANLFNK